MPHGVRLDSVRKVYSDGNHNAFTDICRYKGAYYLTFRNCPDGHMLFTTSRILVLKSTDTHTWDLACEFGIPGRDVRDPHFLCFKDRLYVLSATWLVDPECSHHLDISAMGSYGVWTDDGDSWEGPVHLEGTDGFFVWRAGVQGQTAYLIGQGMNEFAECTDPPSLPEKMESWFLKSDDGLTWEKAGLIQPSRGSEVAFLFEPDGRAVAVARARGSMPGQVWRADAPYSKWTGKALDRNIGGPMLAKWGDHYLVAGRKYVDSGECSTAIYWLEDDGLVEIMGLPSGGDTSYPGFVELASGKGLLSYYSSHEGSGTSLAPSAIYLAELSLVDD